MPKRPRPWSEGGTSHGRPTTESANAIVGVRRSPVGVDHLNSLPREVLGNIIDYLGGDYGVREELFPPRLVCRKWRDAVCLVLEDVLTRQLRDGKWLVDDDEPTRLIACNLPSMSPTLLRSVSGIQTTWGTRARLILKAAASFATTKISRSPHLADGFASGVQTLILNGIADLTDKGLETLAKSLTRLRSLAIQRCNRVTSTGFLALRGLRFLESLELSHCCATDSFLASIVEIQTLRSLALHTGSGLTGTGVRNIARMAELQSLSLQYCLWLSDADLLELSKLSKLKHLNLADGFSQGPEVHDGLVAMVRSSPLVSLVLRYFQSISDSVMFAIAEKEQLSTFSLGNCRFPVTIDAINAVVKGCRSLTDVSLEASVINDETLKLLSELPKLRALRLAEAKNVTAQGWMPLTTAPFLEELRLGSCSGLTDDFLEAIGTLPTLQELSLERCDNVSAAAVEKLRARRLKLNRKTFVLRSRSREDSDADELDSDIDP